MIAVSETSTFQNKVTRLLSEHDREELIAYLSTHPTAGVILEGTGGIRKLRWARLDSGKSGGIRVIYYFHNDSMPLYLLTVFGKNEKANLPRKELKQLSKIVKEIVEFWRKHDE